MKVYRIAQNKYIKDISGTGAKLYGGRWNPVGLPVLYTSQHKSLALLELIVHFSALKALGQDYSFAIIDIPESDIVSIDKNELPENWLLPNNPILHTLTKTYFKDLNSLVLKVPSALVRDEYNYLINPLHFDFDGINVLDIEPALVDERFINMYS